MYEGIKKIEEILLYIENNITNDIECSLLAKKMSLSVYEFRRIFGFIIGCPLSEYIRKRRLSLAACEIATTEKPDLPALSEKYRYSSQAAFSKAFKAHHGCSPTKYTKNSHDIQLFSVPKLEISISNTETIPFRIINEDSFCISGYSGISPITDSCCCEDVWSAFYESEADKTLSSDTIYVAYRNLGNDVNCIIGEKSDKGEHIPASRWACFELDTTDDDEVNKFYGKIIYEWLPSANLKINTKIPIVEVFPFDMSEEGFAWEIRIPIE